MDHPSHPHNLSPEKLARMWDIGSDVCAEATNEAVNVEERYAQLLRDWLARPLPTDADLQELLPEGLGQLCSRLRPFSGDRIGGLLADPATPVSVLERIKHHAKSLGGTATSELERDVTLAVYFAAIASALVFHQARISKHSERKLTHSFAALSTRKGVPPELQSLFQRACQAGKPGSDMPQEDRGRP